MYDDKQHAVLMSRLERRYNYIKSELYESFTGKYRAGFSARLRCLANILTYAARFK